MALKQPQSLTDNLGVVLGTESDLDCLEVAFNGQADVPFRLQFVNWDDEDPMLNVCSFGYRGLDTGGLLKGLLPPYGPDERPPDDMVERVRSAVSWEEIDTDEEMFVVFQHSDPTPEAVETELDSLADEFGATTRVSRKRTLQNLPDWWPDLLTL